MKLKQGVYLHKSGAEYLGITQGKAAESFSGLIRNNATADAILRLLMEETTEQAVIDAVFAKYDAPKEVVEKDVRYVIGELRKAGLLDE